MADASLDCTSRLRQLMQSAGLLSFRALSARSGVSAWQIRQVRRGQIGRLRLDSLRQLSAALAVSVPELLATFEAIPTPTDAPSTDALQAEYARLAAQLAEQRQAIEQELIQTSLQTLESLLLQWPTAAYAAQQNPQAPAVKLLPLLRPLETLLQHWQVEALATVGDVIPYDPQHHQLMDGSAQPGDRVRVRYTGYRQGDRLLYRARVSPAPRVE